jgi:hypothetical protein
MTGSIYEGLFAAGVLAPEHEDHVRATLRDDLNHPVGKGFPAFAPVRSRLVGLYREDSIEQEDALLRPGGKIAACRHRNSQVILQFLEDVLERRG